MIDRRRLLLSGLGGAGIAGIGGLGAAYQLVQHDVLPGKVRLDKALGRCGDLPQIPAETAAVRRERFRSRARGRHVEMRLVTPARAELRGLPVVVVLHGLNGSAATVSDLRVDRFLAHAVATGTRPFAIVGVDGGDTYWHRRASGDDPERMIVEEVLPRLRALGLRTERIGLLGWSMGGYGALLMAGRLGPGRVAAVAASSPALFRSHEAARGAYRGSFDDAGDFARNDVMADLGRLSGVPLWIDCGRSDPFAATTERLRARIRPKAAGGMFRGCHDGAYWARRAPSHLEFLARRLR
ncbi:alpha/beta hydrolase [Spirillospora sp. CA-294931]|uniref:alpha/beta hydrolase n=1 Tax=Spirillospora sp. CA-294931 TaxID=3240042 RepID=UPI003D902B9C